MKDTNSNQFKTVWHRIFRLLSLDCLIAEWSKMGLALNPDEQKFVMEAARVSYLIFQDGALSHYDANFLKAQQALHVFNESLTAFRGDLFRKKIMEWCQSIFVNDRECQIELEWYNSLARLWDNYSNKNWHPNLSEEKLKCLRELIKEYLIIPNQHLDNYLNNPENEIKSDWDQFIYKGGLSPEWEEFKIETEHFYALLEAKIILEYISFSKFWEKILFIFDEDDIETLYQWYRRILREKVQFNPGIDSKPFKGK
jgi:hypothetical protein